MYVLYKESVVVGPHIQIHDTHKHMHGMKIIVVAMNDNNTDDDDDD